MDLVGLHKYFLIVFWQMLFINSHTNTGIWPIIYSIAVCTWIWTRILPKWLLLLLSSNFGGKDIGKVHFGMSACVWRDYCSVCSCTKTCIEDLYAKGVGKYFVHILWIILFKPILHLSFHWVVQFCCSEGQLLVNWCRKINNCKYLLPSKVPHSG